MQFSCASPQKQIIAPPSLRALERLTDHEMAEGAQKYAPRAWAEGIRYLALAGDAIDDGDEAEADRFAELGLIHIKIALASAEQVVARERLEAARARRHKLEQETGRIQALVANLEAQQERERIRRHLVNVLGDGRLMALAADEIREREMTPKEETALNRVRDEVGSQMISRARLSAQIVKTLVSEGRLDPERVVLVGGPLGLAEEDLKKRELITLQEHVEVAGIEARRIIDELWEDGEQKRSDAIENLRRELSSLNIGFASEEYGISVPVDVPKKKRKKKSKDPELSRLAGLLNSHRDFALLVVGSAGPPKVPKKALSRSLERAGRVAKALVQSGVLNGRVIAYGCGSTVPLVSLKEGKEPVAVLFVPIPKRKKADFD